MPQATGIATQLRFGKESAWATPPAAGSGRLVRRKTCDIATMKEAFSSGELLPHYQLNDLRHGLVSSKGTLNAEPVPGGHSDILASSLRKVFVTGATTGALTNVTATATAPHFVRAAGSFITDGFKLFDIVRWTGWTTGGVANNARNYLITVLTATQMTVADLGAATGTVAAKVSGDSVTCTVYGKKSWIPTTGHTDESWSVERLYSDISQSELFPGVKINGFTMKFVTGAMADLSINLMGAGYTNNTSQYFTAPTAVSNTSVLAGSNGGLLVAGGAVAYVRELGLVVDNGIQPVPIIGSNTIAGLVQGPIKVTGNLVAYFQDAVMRDFFLNESEVSLCMYGTTSSGIAADFIQVCMPRIKFLNAGKPDGPSVIAMPLQFQALYNGAGGSTVNTEQTSLSMQDSLAL